MPTAKLIVGYVCRMQPPELIKDLIPEITAKKTLKDPAKQKTPEEKAAAEQAILDDIAEKKAEFEANAKYIPYLGTFQRVVIYDIKNKRTGRWNCDGSRPFGDKSSVSERIVAWLLKGFPTAWGGLDDKKEPEVRFLGFGMRDFLKMLGTESTMPYSVDVPPPKLWYSNSDHRELADAVAPDQAGKLLDLRKIIGRRRPEDEKAGKKWDEQFSKWVAPHVSADLDAWLCTELASQLGFLTE